MHTSPTNILFIWHMHQPYYRVPGKRFYALPWVRFHAVKDYYGMAKTLAKFEKVKATFNFSGVLIEQLLDYALNKAQDTYGILTLKNPSHLTKEERDFVIERFFGINFDRFIKHHPRYLQLYNKRSTDKNDFSAKDIVDLQALYNLSWFHPLSLQEDEHLAALAAKKRDYTAQDKEYIINKQYEIIAAILPLYRSLLEAGRIELSLTPFYHPIMPLIYDTEVVAEFPHLAKPGERFSTPAHCHWHLEESRKVFKKAFAHVPVGSWPSEGSVSEKVMAVYDTEGFRWIGADEGILFKSLAACGAGSLEEVSKQRFRIYQPYSFEGVDIFFRDRNLSDMIGFTYNSWEDPVFAAYDMLGHFKKTHDSAKSTLKDRAVSIIMDGENAWEHYHNNGLEFFEALYWGLEKSLTLTTSTPSQFLENRESEPLEKLASGSWINGDFGVWAGSDANNDYWSLLVDIKRMIDESKHIAKEELKKAKDYLYILEGSDWFWWNTFHDVRGEFKDIFFSYIKEAYKIFGKKPPLPRLPKAKSGT